MYLCSARFFFVQMKPVCLENLLKSEEHLGNARCTLRGIARQVCSSMQLFSSFCNSSFTESVRTKEGRTWGTIVRYIVVYMFEDTVGDESMRKQISIRCLRDVALAVSNIIREKKPEPKKFEAFIDSIKVALDALRRIQMQIQKTKSTSTINPQRRTQTEPQPQRQLQLQPQPQPQPISEFKNVLEYVYAEGEFMWAILMVRDSRIQNIVFSFLVQRILKIDENRKIFSEDAYFLFAYGLYMFARDVEAVNKDGEDIFTRVKVPWINFYFIRIQLPYFFLFLGEYHLMKSEGREIEPKRFERFKEISWDPFFLEDQMILNKWWDVTFRRVDLDKNF